MCGVRRSRGYLEQYRVYGGGGRVSPPPSPCHPTCNTRFLLGPETTLGRVLGSYRPPPPPSVIEPPMFDRGTRGWFLRSAGSSPVLWERNSGALRRGMCALSFPTVKHIHK